MELELLDFANHYSILRVVDSAGPRVNTHNFALRFNFCGWLEGGGVNNFAGLGYFCCPEKKSAPGTQGVIWTASLLGFAKSYRKPRARD